MFISFKERLKVLSTSGLFIVRINHLLKVKSEKRFCFNSTIWHFVFMFVTQLRRHLVSIYRQSMALRYKLSGKWTTLHINSNWYYTNINFSYYKCKHFIGLHNWFQIAELVCLSNNLFFGGRSKLIRRYLSLNYKSFYYDTVQFQMMSRKK